jgi:hypothetical protein
MHHIALLLVSHICAFYDRSRGARIRISSEASMMCSEVYKRQVVRMLPLW